MPPAASDGPISDGGQGVFGRIEVRLDRIEDKIDARMTTLDAKVSALDLKVDGVTSRQDRVEGGLGMIKWLGPAAITALVGGFLKAAGIW